METEDKNRIEMYCIIMCLYLGFFIYLYIQYDELSQNKTVKMICNGFRALWKWPGVERFPYITTNQQVSNNYCHQRGDDRKSLSM